MNYGKWVRELVVAALMGGALYSAAGVYGEGGYPPDYKPSQPAEKGDTNVLARVLAVSTYMNDKLNAAGGPNSPMCYRNCLTVSFNDVLKCTEAKSSYATSEGCEQDAAQKIAACNPKCQ
ncbi:MAG TPA: hypothetical protein VKJ47_22815 [Candidatus Binatia bacterium]|nr:hypothetical protein [Candidatus Binatia bacterium]